MRGNIAVGIDIGTESVKVVVAEHSQKGVAPRIIGVGIAQAKGLRHGYIINTEEALESLRHAVSQAEKSAGVEIKKAFLGISGIGLTSTLSHGSIMVTRADSEITDLDMKKVQEACEHDLPPSVTLNRKLIHSIPLAYRIDGKPVIGRPQGMKGLKIEVRMLFIFELEQHLTDLVSIVGDAGIEIEDVMAAPIAASLVALSKAQKIAGVVLANIGADTVSVVVFENNIPLSLEIFPIGSNDITNDIALGLRISLEQAEKVKLGSDESFPKKKYEDIITARLSDIFELIDGHLKKINRSGLLPAGIVLSGGGAKIDTIEQTAKHLLKLPSRISAITAETILKNPIRDSLWSVAYGLCIFGLNNEQDHPYGITHTVTKTKNKILDWIKQFLP